MVDRLRTCYRQNYPVMKSHCSVFWHSYWGSKWYVYGVSQLSHQSSTYWQSLGLTRYLTCLRLVRRGSPRAPCRILRCPIIIAFAIVGALHWRCLAYSEEHLGSYGLTTGFVHLREGATLKNSCELLHLFGLGHHYGASIFSKELAHYYSCASWLIAVSEPGFAA